MCLSHIQLNFANLDVASSLLWQLVAVVPQQLIVEGSVVVYDVVVAAYNGTHVR